MELQIHRFELPLRHPFTTSHGTKTTQRTVVVELVDGALRGFGEAAEIDYHGAMLERIVQALQTARPVIESETWDEPAQLWSALQPQLGSDPFALCAVDQAAHDLWGRRRGEPVWKLWGLDRSRNPPSNYTIGLAPVDRMIAKLNEFDRFPVYKIKLGTDQDVSIVRALRDETDAVVRVDANGGWNLSQALENAAALRDLDVEFIEQPLPVDRWDDMARVHRESALPVIADESCVGEDDVARCAACFHGINIKLTKCGGRTPARRMIERARSLGLTVMAGCMTESTVGISAIGQILPLLDCVDMDGALLLAEDVAEGVRVVDGRAVYPEAAGTGVRLLRRNPRGRGTDRPH